MNGQVSEALQRFWKVRANFDSEPILALAMRNGLASNMVSAHVAIESVLQLLCSHAESPQIGTPFVFASGEVYGVYHAIRLHFGNNFDGWCHAEFDTCHHHLLLRDIASSQPDVQAGLAYTLGQLDGQFGNELSAALCYWLERHENNQLHPCALIWAKTWKGEMFDPSPHAVTKLCDRWIQYQE